MEIIEDYAQFFTVTIYEWKPVLAFPEVKKIILDSLSFLYDQKRCYVYAFVIMNNHIHLIWQMREGHLLQDIQRDFLKFTAQKIKFFLQDHHSALLRELEVNLKDRKYQIWQRNSLNVPLYSEYVFQQQLDYIHQNPVKAGLCSFPSDYDYSSAQFYFKGVNKFNFLEHHEG